MPRPHTWYNSGEARGPDMRLPVSVPWNGLVGKSEGAHPSETAGREKIGQFKAGTMARGRRDEPDVDSGRAAVESEKLY